MSKQITTTLNPVEKSIFDLMYEKYNQDGSVASISIMDLDELVKKGTESKDIDKAIHKFRGYGLLETSSNIDYRCTLNGVLSYESNFQLESVYNNNKIRRAILEYLFNQFSNEPNLAWEHEDFKKDQKLGVYSNDELLRNLWVLKEKNLIKGDFMSGGEFHFIITSEGIDLVSNPVELKSSFPVSSTDKVSLESVSGVVRAWVPRQKRKSEEAYKAELAEHLRNNGFPKTTEERGESLCDILVEELIPIEVKKEPTKAELDRLTGQLLEMLGEYKCVIACIVGSSGKVDLIERFSKRFKDNKDVVIILKP